MKADWIRHQLRELRSASPVLANDLGAQSPNNGVALNGKPTVDYCALCMPHLAVSMANPHANIAAVRLPKRFLHGELGLSACRYDIPQTPIASASPGRPGSVAVASAYVRNRSGPHITGAEDPGQCCRALATAARRGCRPRGERIWARTSRIEQQHILRLDCGSCPTSTAEESRGSATGADCTLRQNRL